MATKKIAKKIIKKNTKSGISAGKVIAIGAGVAALGAGAYYLLGPDGKKNQKKVGVWIKDAKKNLKKEIKKEINPIVKKVKKEVKKRINL